MKKLSDKHLMAIRSAVANSVSNAAYDAWAVIDIIEANNAEIEETPKRGDIIAVSGNPNGSFATLMVFWGKSGDGYHNAAIRDGHLVEGQYWRYARKIDLAKLLENESGQISDTLPCDVEPYGG